MLGFVCSLFAILPVVGTPLVWLPVAGGLFIVGATFKTVILLVIGGALGLGPGGLILGPLIFRLAKERWTRSARMRRRRPQRGNNAMRYQQ